MKYLLPLYPLLLVVAVTARAVYAITAVVALGVFALLTLFQIDSVTRNLSFERIHPERGFVGDDLIVELEITNLSKFKAPWLELADAVPIDLRTPESGVAKVITVGRRQTDRLTYRIHCHKRGLYRIGPLRATVGTLFGPMAVRLPELPTTDFVVYPEIWPIDALNLPARAPIPNLSDSSSLIEDPYRITGVRDYRDGDSPRQIEWLASARSGRLLVKQFNRATSRDLMICLDLCRSNHERWTSGTDVAVSTAASIAHHAITKERLSAGLVVNGHDPLGSQQSLWLPGSSHPHLKMILAFLARVESTPDDQLLGLIETHAARIPFGSTLMILTGKVNDSLHGLMERLKSSGHPVVVGLIQPRPDDPKRLGNIPLYHIRDRNSLRGLSNSGIR